MNRLLEVIYDVEGPEELEDTLAVCATQPLCRLAYARRSAAAPTPYPDQVVSLWQCQAKGGMPDGMQYVWQPEGYLKPEGSERDGWPMVADFRAELGLDSN